MAALRGVGPTRALRASAMLAIFLIIGAPSHGLAADPSQDPTATARPPSCAERFPAEGPAGVDLRLGCVVGEVVGNYIPGQSAAPPPLSSYALSLGILIAGVIIGIWLLARLVARRVGRRLAPVLPAEWWACTSCKSVNGGNVARCYSCGSVRPDGPMLATDDRPTTPQSFGGTRKNG